MFAARCCSLHLFPLSFFSPFLCSLCSLPHTFAPLSLSLSICLCFVVYFVCSPFSNLKNTQNKTKNAARQRVLICGSTFFCLSCVCLLSVFSFSLLLCVCSPPLLLSDHCIPPLNSCVFIPFVFVPPLTPSTVVGGNRPLSLSPALALSPLSLARIVHCTAFICCFLASTHFTSATHLIRCCALPPPSVSRPLSVPIVSCFARIFITSFCFIIFVGLLPRLTPQHHMLNQPTISASFSLFLLPACLCSALLPIAPSPSRFLLRLPSVVCLL